MLRGRAEAARRAHNPEVTGSNPVPAIKKTLTGLVRVFIIHTQDAMLINAPEHVELFSLGPALLNHLIQ